MNIKNFQSFKRGKEQLENFLKKKKVKYKIITLTGSTKTVQEASKELSVDSSEIVKSLIFITEEGKPVLCIVRGDRKVDRKKLKKILGTKDVKLASPKEVLEITGFEVGGVPPVGLKGLHKIIIDENIMEKPVVYGGGGEGNLILEINPEDIKKLVNAEITDISKNNFSK